MTPQRRIPVATLYDLLGRYSYRENLNIEIGHRVCLEQAARFPRRSRTDSNAIDAGIS